MNTGEPLAFPINQPLVGPEHDDVHRKFGGVVNCVHMIELRQINAERVFSGRLGVSRRFWRSKNAKNRFGVS